MVAVERGGGGFHCYSHFDCIGYIIEYFFLFKLHGIVEYTDPKFTFLKVLEKNNAGAD